MSKENKTKKKNTNHKHPRGIPGNVVLWREDGGGGARGGPFAFTRVNHERGGAGLEDGAASERPASPEVKVRGSAAGSERVRRAQIPAPRIGGGGSGTPHLGPFEGISWGPKGVYQAVQREIP